MAADPREEDLLNRQRQLDAAIEDMGTVLVRAARDDGRVALWDTGPEYDGGEVMIKGNAGDPDKDFTYEVPRTAAVMRQIKNGSLVEVDDADEGAGPAPEPAPLRLTPDGEPMATSEPEGGHQTEATPAATDETVEDTHAAAEKPKRGRPAGSGTATEGTSQS